jgi:hypothetical protein
MNPIDAPPVVNVKPETLDGTLDDGDGIRIDQGGREIESAHETLRRSAVATLVPTDIMTFVKRLETTENAVVYLRRADPFLIIDAKSKARRTIAISKTLAT